MIGGRRHSIICSILFAYQLAQSSFNALLYFANARFARMIFISRSFGPELNQSTKSFRASPSSLKRHHVACYSNYLRMRGVRIPPHLTGVSSSQNACGPCSSGRMLKLIPNRLLLFPAFGGKAGCWVGGRSSIAPATVALMSSHDNVIGLRVLGITNRKVIVGQDSWQDVSHTSTHTVSLLTSS